MDSSANDKLKALHPQSIPARHSLTDHKGIMDVATTGDSSRVEVAFDPKQLSDADVQVLLQEHQAEVSARLSKLTFRLQGSASERAAQKLERRLAGIPGVRRATATFLGQVLTVTFDSETSPAASMQDAIRSQGATILPYEQSFRESAVSGWITTLRSGRFNQEIACALGLVLLIAGWTAERFSASPAVIWSVYALAYVFSGEQGIRSAVASLRQHVLDVDVLMILAALGAALIGAPFEGALLLFLFSLSNVLQQYAMQRTHRAIESLLKLRPNQAQVRRGGTVVSVPAEELMPDDIVLVRPGEYVPSDGVVIEGSSSTDESSLTGESMPVIKQPGDAVFGGSVNQRGGLEIRVTRRVTDSTLSKMITLVAEAQAEKSSTQRFLEQAEQYYATGVIALTAALIVVPVAVLHQPFSQAFYRAMTLMVVASPCALVISTPATVLSAIGGAARRGILIKGGSHLERAAEIRIVAVDKTGTLTAGRPALMALITPSASLDLPSQLPPDVAQLLQAAMSLEQRSEHPLAEAVVRCGQACGLSPMEASDFQSTTGKGAEATVNGQRYVLGSQRLFQEQQAQQLPLLAAAAERMQAAGRTCVWMGVRTEAGLRALAVLVLADTLRPEAPILIQRLHQLGVQKVVMLTGDHRLAAEAIAREAGVDEVRAELLPADKVTAIRELKREGRVMMIGDGVNDAPALAASDLGVAMGAAGTDVAMETADVVLMGDQLSNVAVLLQLARRARRILIQNIIFAGSVIVLLAGAALGFSLPLPIGVIGHEGSTVLVCLNGLRMLLVTPAAEADSGSRPPA